MSTNIATLPTTQAVDTRYTQDVIPVLDTSKFEHMQRIAMVMAECSTIPDTFRYVDGKKEKGELPRSVVIANCFRVVNQAVRWGFDPFAVMDSVSLVHGKMMYEGKLIAAAIEAKLGIRLHYEFDDAKGDSLAVTISGTLPGETTPRSLTGTVKQWHRGDKSPWAHPADWKRQLRYRGAREWCRAYTPEVILGIYSTDELQEIASFDIPAGQRAQRMKDVTPAKPAPLELPDIPDEPAQSGSSDQTSEAREAIRTAINLEMLAHVRDAYDEADWNALEPDYDAKAAELEAVQT